MILFRVGSRNPNFFLVPTAAQIRYGKYGPRVKVSYHGKLRYLIELPRIKDQVDVSRWVNPHYLDDLGRLCSSLEDSDIEFIGTHLTVEDTIRAVRGNEGNWKRLLREELRLLFHKHYRVTALSRRRAARLIRDAATHARMAQLKLKRGLDRATYSAVLSQLQTRQNLFLSVKPILDCLYSRRDAYRNFKPSYAVLEARRTLTTIVRKYASEIGIGSGKSEKTIRSMAQYVQRLNLYCAKLNLAPLPENQVRNRRSAPQEFGQEVVRLFEELCLLDPVSRLTKLDLYW